ncbi:MAG: hypothetical protein IT495_02970 [Gammaproteobacteria bacterium]|nr:hypothetical protein [Gammaproteobacteria bacterium]
MRALAHLLAALAGFVLGALVVLAGLYFFPFAHVDRTARMLAQFPEQALDLWLVLEGEVDGSGTPVSITHGGNGPFAPSPPGIGLLSEPAINAGLALVTRVHDGRGNIVGVATELEAGHPGSNLLRGRIMTHTTWSAILPGRGGIVLYQVEDNWILATRVIGPALLRKRAFHGPWRNVNTLGPRADGRGYVVAGTGEFAGRAGTFIETAEMREFRPDGHMSFTMDMRVIFDPPSTGTP